jgi:endonuclease/exonuclease/phosphatase family metal-dependent hydrolase
MRKGLLAVISAVLCFVMILSVFGCSAEKFGDESGSDSDVNLTESATVGSDKKTEKPTEKKTEKRTEKKTEKQTEKPITFNVRFASYNIYHAEKAGYDYSKIAKNITDNGIEIAGFQEVDNNVNRSNKKAQIKEIANKTGYQYYKFFKAIDLQGGGYGLGIVSKYPIESTNLIKLSSGSAEQRILAHAVINVNGTKINFFVTHLSYDGEGGGSSRSKQFSEVASELAKYDNFVLSGEFNTRNLDEYNVISGSALVNSKDDPKVTYPDGRSPLDNLVYSTATWKFGAINVVTNSYSDHYMIHSVGTFTKAK